MVHFGPKRAKHGLSTLQSGPKEPERDQGVFDHLEPFWAYLDPFDHLGQKSIKEPLVLGSSRGPHIEDLVMSLLFYFGRHFGD